MQVQNQNILFAPKFSLLPNKICLYNEVSIRKNGTNEFYNINHLKKIINEENEVEVIKKKITKKFHNFEISKNAYKNLQNKITWLYHLAKSRHIVTHNSKNIYNFKMLFLTLTLPSKQVHPTSFITKVYFNQFITEIRKITKMKNFVWRLEFQKNGNVHYHIVTDTYIDYFTARKIWNRIINKGNYVNEYSKKFNSMSLKNYYDYVINQQFSYGKNPLENPYYSFKAVAKRYALQKKDSFSQPSSIDVKSVSNNKKISSYISKYFGKNKSENCKSNVLDNEENSFGLRLWFCSRSLSKLKSICEYINEINWSPIYILKASKKIKFLYHKYCTVVYFEYSELESKVKKVFAQLFHRYSRKLGYSPAT